MKRIMIITLLCFGITGSQAQTNDVQTTDRQLIKERAIAIYKQTNGNMGPEARMKYKTNYSQVHAAYPDAPANAVPAWPTSNQYTALQDPPCYKYKNQKGSEVTKCPGANFLPEQNDLNESAVTVNDQKNDTWNVMQEKSYTGNYPNIQSLYPGAPANAVPAWPSSTYTQLQNPPCYEYLNKRGLKVMECPGARFEPEHVYRQ